MKLKRLILIALVISLGLMLNWQGQRASALPSPGKIPSQPTAGFLADYLVFEKTTGGKILPVFSKPVTLASELAGMDESQLDQVLAAGDRNAGAILVTLQTPSGQAAYRDVVQVPAWLRGEFEGENGEIDGYFFQPEQTSFVVRVPRLPGATLTLADADRSVLAEFSLSELESLAPLAQTDPSLVPTPAFPGSGSPANRVDLLIMGDGYTAAQQALFNADVASAMTTFFNVSPANIYQNYFNVTSLFVPSTQSGADHPPYNAACTGDNPACCGDSTMLSDPLKGTFKNTAFDARFCAYNIHRLLVVDQYKVLTAASAYPDWDLIMVLANDKTYGGSGGYISVSSTDIAAPLIMQHEFGHSFAELADEYDSPYPGFPACSDLGGSQPCEANVTDQNVRAQIKWEPWIEDSTPIPTSETQQYANVVGLFPGARYLSAGMYRSGQSCLMRYLGLHYCQVPGQAFILKLYQGWYGDPWDGIELIEPDTMLPSEHVILTHPASQVFQADILQPVGGPPAAIEWYVNDVLQAGSTSSSFVYNTDLSQPTLTIEMRVKDTTTLVHPDMANGALQSSFTWQVTVCEEGDCSFLPLIRR